jgi:hypothetical protein
MMKGHVSANTWRAGTSWLTGRRSQLGAVWGQAACNCLRNS